MMHLLYDPFPDTVTADGETFRVLTDFREWMRFADMLADPELMAEEKAYLCRMWFDPEPDTITESQLLALIGFYRADALHPDPPDQDEEDEPEEEPVHRPYFDWKIDAAYLIGDFRHYYGIDLLTIEFLHWFKFRALFEALPDDSTCMKRIAYRSADLNKIRDKHERARIARIQKQIALPFELDDAAIGEIFSTQ